MNKSVEIVKDILSANPLTGSFVASEFIEKYYGIYLADHKAGNSISGGVFEQLILIALLKSGLTPVYKQVKLAFVPNVKYDLLLYNKDAPIVISAKTSTRERWKQADLEAVALKYVHRKAECFLLMYDSAEYNVRKGAGNSYLGIDDFILATAPAFDDLINEMKKKVFTESDTVSIVEDAKKKVVTMGKVTKIYPTLR